MGNAAPPRPYPMRTIYVTASACVMKLPLEQRVADMSSDGGPFVFTLMEAECECITGADIVGKGGLQSLLRRLKEKLEDSPTLEFDNWELGQLIRYMTKHGDGGFEGRLRRAFARSFLDLFTPVYEAERRS